MEDTINMIEALVAQIKDLESRIARMEMRAEQRDGSSATSAPALPVTSDEDDVEAMLPFSIFYESDATVFGQTGFYVYVPKGCVRVNSKIATFPDAVNDCVLIEELKKDESSQIVYAHVSSEHEVTFTCNGKTEEDIYCFRIGVFDGNYTRMCSSLVIINEGVASPGNFDPVFKDGVLSYTSDGFYPYGRKFKYVELPTVDDSAKIGEGVIYLEVTHYETGSGSIPVIKGVPEPADFNNESKEMTNIPLYRLEDGAMVQDYRSVMSLVLRDL